MLQFALVNLETMEEKPVDGLSIQTVKRPDDKPARVLPMNDCYLAVYIAKTVAHKVVQYMANKTQTTIDDSFRRFNGMLTAWLNESDRTDDEVEQFIIRHMQSIIMNDDDRDVSGMYTHSQDFFSVAYTGILEGKALYNDRLSITNHSFFILNQYIESLRTANTREVLTAYDLESDEKINTELRRLTKGLTEREEQDNQTIKNSQLGHAIVETSKECTDRQKTVMYYLAKGMSVRQTAKKLDVTARAVQKHKEYIQKKLMKHDIIWEYITSREE